MITDWARSFGLGTVVWIGDASRRACRSAICLENSSHELESLSASELDEIFDTTYVGSCSGVSVMLARSLSLNLGFEPD
jgi:hypothetical protein